MPQMVSDHGRPQIAAMMTGKDDELERRLLDGKYPYQIDMSQLSRLTHLRRETSQRREKLR